MNPLPPLIFGEVLFDHFPDGQKRLGGAPFNVAWHLHGFGLPAYLISRIGHDAEGDEVLQALQAWGMDSGGLQRDAEHPTGQVKIEWQEGTHHFEILPEQAYDYIALNSVPSGSFGLIYFGSLIQRQATAYQSLQCLKASAIPCFVDINLRAPWWTPEIIIDSVKQTRWLKINHDELDTLREVLGINGDFRGQLAEDLVEKYDLELLIVTCGEEGAFLVNREQQVFTSAPSTTVDVVDTVGAGDAFSAVCIMGLLHHWDEHTLLKRAQAFASRICQIQGATALDKALYRFEEHEA